MSDGIGDCARIAESKARKWLFINYPNLNEFNPYHVPKIGEGFVVYETYIDHNVEIIKNCNVIKCFQFKPFEENPVEIDILKQRMQDIVIAKDSRIKGK